MGQTMNENKLFTVLEGEADSKRPMVQVRPTEYLLGLHPHEAINVLRANVQTITEKVENCSKGELTIPKQDKKLQDLVLELEIAQGYLAQAFKTWQAIQ